MVRSTFRIRAKMWKVARPDRDFQNRPKSWSSDNFLMLRLVVSRNGSRTGNDEWKFLVAIGVGQDLQFGPNAESASHHVSMQRQMHTEFQMVRSTLRIRAKI